ncbi:zinc finger protein 84-like protein [Aphelenchoides avenae]|nr:zinc finger protein 84-like protein [Aphelenchus avenae]
MEESEFDEETLEANNPEVKIIGTGESFVVIAMEVSDDKPHVCPLCEARFSEKAQLTRHSVVHSEERPFACTQCSKTYKAKHQLKAHSVVHTGERPFKCPFCEDTFKYQSHLIIHRRLHTGVGESSCPEVARASLQSNCWKHTKRRIPKRGVKVKVLARFACPNCEKRFKYQCDLYYHRRIHSGGVFQCTFKFCKYWTPQRNLLAAHLKTHTGERNHKCDLCDKAFIERTALLKHVRAIHEKLKPFKCEKCDYSASRNAHLTLHVKTVHDGAMPFECGKCDFEAKRADRLKEHVLKEHGNHVANNNKTKGTKETSLNCPSKAPEPDAPSTMPASKSGRATRNNKMSEAHVQVVEEGRNVSDTAGNDFESLGTLSVSAVNTPVPMHDGFRDRDSVPRKQFRRHWDHGIVFREIARNPGTESVKNFTAVMSHGFRHGTGITDSGEVVI